MMRSRLVVVCLLLGWLLSGVGCTTVETKSPEPHSPLLVARAGNEAILSWNTRSGEWYTILYAEGRKSGVDWRPLPGATRILGTGSEVRRVDHPQAGVTRYYRLLIEPF